MVQMDRRAFLAVLGGGVAGVGATYLGASRIDDEGEGDDDNDDGGGLVDSNGTDEDDESHSDAGDGVVVESFLTSEEGETTDTPSVWHGEDDHLLVVTDKGGDQLIVYDATDGEYRGRIGGDGTAPGEFRYPNEVDIVDDWAFVVERDNARVQVLRLPEGDPIGTFGEDDLRAPYGCAIVPDSDGYELYVTDNYEADGADELDERIKRYRVTVSEGGIGTEFLGSFGATSTPGALEAVESIHADPEYDRLVIADEETKEIKLYSLEGEFTEVVSDVFDEGLFDAGDDPEGIALYRDGEGGGYWLCTEQTDPSVFHVLDRESFEYVTRFSGETTANTDGVWLTQEAFGPFSGGAFYADHDDRAVAAFDFEEVSREIGRSD